MSAQPESSIHAALARLEQRAQSSASGWRLLMYAIILWPAVPLLPALMGAEVQLDQLGIGALASFALGAVSFWYSAALRREVRGRLAGSNLATSIAAGEMTANELREAVSWPWRNLIREGTKLEDALQRVAGNLDWYLDAEQSRRSGNPARRLFRAVWIYSVVATLLSVSLLAETCYIMYVYSVILKHAPNATWLQRPLIIEMAILLPLTFIYFRRQVWTEELARYLREQLDREPPA